MIGCKEKAPDSQQSEATENDSAKEIETARGSLNLKILYAGMPETRRAKDFMDFLGKYFTEVKFTDFLGFDENRTTGFDVVILDYDGRELRAPLPKISRQYSRATITVGVPGAMLCSRLSLKTGYL